MEKINASADLSTLPFVSLDLETTGININEDYIVEIGAIRIEGETLLENENFTRLVNPQRLIDEASESVHGISNEMVAKSPTFLKVNPALQNFLRHHIIVGFNIGFDLGIIHEECKRIKHNPEEYRWLDIKFLAICLNIATPSLSLEKLAEIFKVPLSNRHRALGDALTTAKIFIQMIPLLKSRGIRSLAEAERITHQHLSLLSGMIPPSWYYPTWLGKEVQDSGALAVVEDLERIDPYPFKSSMRNIMRKSLVYISEDNTIEEAVKKLRQHDIGSLIVRAAGKKRYSLLSERNILHFLHTHGAQVMKKTIAEMNLNPHPAIMQNEYIYQAIEKLQEHQVNHLLVTNRHEELVGIVSSRDLMRDRLSHFHKTTGIMRKASNVQSLAEVWNGMPQLCALLLREKLSSINIARIISNHTIALTAQTAQLAEKKMLAEGHGKAPAKYAVLVLGSGGRRESLLATDQDNAIIYEDVENKSEAQQTEISQWFLKLGEIISELLNEAGIKLCDGGVMAKNPEWCKSSLGWRRHIEGWLSSSKGEAILQADIFFDYEFAYGTRTLSHHLKRAAFSVAKTKLNFLRLMGEDIIANYANPLRWWGTRLATDAGRLDLKAALIFPVVATTRLLAIQAGYYEESATAARLKAVERLLSLPFADVETLGNIHQKALEIVLNQQLRDIEVGKTPSNKVNVSMLEISEEKFIKRSVNYLTHVEDMIRATLSKI